MIDLERMRTLHLVGIGGAGMSAIARLLHQSGLTITGSDLHRGSSLDELADLGLDVWTGSRPDRIGAVDAVIASSAVPQSDRELEWAREAGIPVAGRPDLLGAMTRAVPTVGAAGTHGKTTSTAMLVTALKATGLDPSFVVGGALLESGTNGHLGGDNLLVLEADEAFGTFLHLALGGLMVTNVEPDHLDHYGTEDELLGGFVTVASGVDGPVLVCADDPGARHVGEMVGAISYGMSAEADWRISAVEQGSREVSFRIDRSDAGHRVTLPRIGLHDVRNATGVLALVGEMGRDVEAAAAGLSRFGGIARRFEDRGTVGGVRIIDDYAHHPTEIEAVLRAGRASAPSRLWAVFQPHLYSRTLEHLAHFGRALGLADEVVVTDIFGAREDPIPGVTGEILVDEVTMSGSGSGSVIYVPHRSDIADHLAARVAPGDLVLILGAGDITLVAGELINLLEEAEL